jgi:hypothetical protein
MSAPAGPRSRLHRARKRAQVTAHVGRDQDEKEPELQEVSRTLLALLLLLTASRALADPIAPAKIVVIDGDTIRVGVRSYRLIGFCRPSALVGENELFA